MFCFNAWMFVTAWLHPAHFCKEQLSSGQMQIR